MYSYTGPRIVGPWKKQHYHTITYAIFLLEPWKTFFTLQLAYFCNTVKIIFFILLSDLSTEFPIKKK